MNRTLAMGLFAAGVLLASAVATEAAAPPPITAAAFLPDGTGILVGSQAGVDVLTWPELTLVDRLLLKMPHVYDLRFSPAGDRLAVAGGWPGERGEVELFAWPTRQPLAQAIAHNDSVYGVAWRTDGAALLTASWDKTARITNFGAGRSIALEGHSRGVLAAEFAGATVVTASADHSLRVWDAASGKLLRSLENHTAPVRSLALRPRTAELPWVASAGADGVVRFWQPTLGRLVRFTRLPAEPLGLAWMPAGDRLLVSCRDGRIRTIDPETADLLFDLPALDEWAYVVLASPDGRAAFVGGAQSQKCVVSLAQEFAGKE